MNPERDLQVIEIEGAPVLRYDNATANSVRADVYLTKEIYDKICGDYATQVPRFRLGWPTPEEFANEALEYVLDLGWSNGLPEDVMDLLSGRRVALFNGHGNHYNDIGWGTHLYDGKLIPMAQLLDHYQISGYETVLFAVCNPKSDHLVSRKGAVIYPVGNFGINPDEFEMVVRRDLSLTGSK